MKTVLLYIIVEIISLYFFYLANKKRSGSSHKKGKIKISTIFIICSFLPLLILLTFRDLSVGMDTKAYADLFNRINSRSYTTYDKDWVGWGYWKLNELIGYFFNKNVIALHFIIGFITLYCFYKVIWKYSEKPVFSLFIYFSTCLYLQSLNQARQMMAIAITFIGYKYLKEKRIINYFVLICCAGLIHPSAFLMIPVYWVSNIKLNNNRIIGYLLITLVAFLNFDVILKIISFTSYAKYFKTSYANFNISSLYNLVVRVCFLVLVVYFLNVKKENFEKYRILCNLVLLCTIFSVLTLKMYIISRVAMYFYVYYILLIPNLINSDKKNLKLYELGIVILFLMYFAVYYFKMAPLSGYDVYKFI